MTIAFTNERMYVARSNLINILNHANYPEEALVYIHQNEIINPDNIDNQLEKAFSLFLMNNRDGAEKILLETLDRADLPEEYRTKILFNLGTYLLWKDQFLEGLNKFLIEGAKLDYWRKAKLPFPFWEGGVQPGKTILLYAEAGIGDEIINVRFMRHLENYGMNPIWITNRKDMLEIFNYNGFPATDDWEQFKGRDDVLWTYPMSLPVYLELKYADLYDGPYLDTLPEYMEKWDWMKSSKMKIGIRWQGNPAYDQDLHRSVPLGEIWDSISHLDADFYSLQKDNGLEEIEDRPIIRLDEKLETFMDLMAAIEHLDLVITSCTSVVHAAAAMGKRTIILCPISAYYTWSHTAAKSPWYGDNVTIIRQVAPRSWKVPLCKLKEYLKDGIPGL